MNNENNRSMVDSSLNNDLSTASNDNKTGSNSNIPLNRQVSIPTTASSSCATTPSSTIIGGDNNNNNESTNNSIFINNDNNDVNMATTNPFLEMEESTDNVLHSSALIGQEEEENNNSALLSPLLLMSNVRSQIKSSSSLARSNTTPNFFAILIPILIIGCHFIFLYGQIKPMWKLQLSQHVNIWANATGKEAKWAFDTLNLDHDLHYEISDDKSVETFTYWYAIKQLWRAKGIPGSKFMPRLAAVGLTFFSGIWPHLKLLLLNLSFLLPSSNKSRRTNNLRWLSSLGKWSLADVLAVCVMVGVLNLEWIVNPLDIKHGLIDQLPLLLSILSSIKSPTDLCTMLLHYGCENPSKFFHKTKCLACKSLIGNAFNHPDWVQTTGKVILDGVDTATLPVVDANGNPTDTNFMKLSVVGMRGIYAFCLAVILSILLSVVVDIFDHRDRHNSNNNKTRQQQNATTGDGDDVNQLLLHEEGLETNAGVEEHQQRLVIDGNNDASNQNTSPSSLNSSLSDVSDHMRRQRIIDNSPMDVDMWSGWHGERRLQQQQFQQEFSNNDRPFQLNIQCSKETTMALLTIVPFVTTICVLLACVLPSMERKVQGAIPKLLHDVLGFDANKFYSLRTLMQTTGEAGGWDYLLMSTFSLFVVVGPCVRAILCIFGLGMPSSLSRVILMSIDFIGAFCAWEVLFVAVFMVDMLMPSITSTIVNKPECKQVPGVDGGSCLEVEYNILQPFGFVFVGGVLLIITAMFANQKLHYTYTHVNPSLQEEEGSGDVGENHYVPLDDGESDGGNDVNSRGRNARRLTHDNNGFDAPEQV